MGLRKAVLQGAELSEYDWLLERQFVLVSADAASIDSRPARLNLSLLRTRHSRKFPQNG